MLTYFDNPGVSIPSAITSWVAMNGMPDFLEKLRTATVAYSHSKVVPAAKAELNTTWPVVDPGYEYPPDHIPIYINPGIQHKLIIYT